MSDQFSGMTLAEIGRRFITTEMRQNFLSNLREELAACHRVTKPAWMEQTQSVWATTHYLRARRLRTPDWADREAIARVYAEARRLTAETGIRHTVDHEIPLRGEFVSGLHVAANLQILTDRENSKKRNRYEVV